MNRRSLVRGASEDQDSPETVNSIDILEDQYSENTVNNINILEDQNLGDTVNDYPCAAKYISGDAGVANLDRNKRARNISGDAGVANLDKNKYVKITSGDAGVASQDNNNIDEIVITCQNSDKSNEKNYENVEIIDNDEICSKVEITAVNDRIKMDCNHFTQKQLSPCSHNYKWLKGHHVLPLAEMGCAALITMDLWSKLNNTFESCEITDEFNISEIDKIDDKLLSRIEAHYSYVTGERAVIIDSGATNHMFPHMKFLNTIEELKSPQFVSLGDPLLKIEIVARGDNNIVGNCLLVPKLQYGLISVPQLDQSGFVTIFENEKCIIHNNNQIVLEATLRDNLYFVDKRYLRHMSHNPDVETDELNPSISDVREYVNTMKEQHEDQILPDARDVVNAEKRKRRKFIRAEDISSEEQEHIDREWYQLHNKWGHLSDGRMRLAINKGLISGDVNLSPEQIARAKLGLCYDCMRGRMKSGPHKQIHISDYKPFEKIAVDYKGPITPKSYNKYSGFYLFSDQASNFVWVYHVKKKSEFLDAFNTFSPCLERQCQI